MKIPKEKTVAFTGYRTTKILKNKTKLNLIDEIFTTTYQTISKLHARGYRIFLSGMADGFDMIAAKAVLKFKNEQPDVLLIAVVPFPGQENNYGATDKQNYRQIIAQANHCIYLSEKFTDNDQFLRRNDFLLDNSSLIVCYYDGQRGGTMYTYNRAAKMGRPIINICAPL